MLFVMTASADTATFSMAKKWTSTSATDNGVTVTFSDVVGNAQTGYFKFTKGNTLTINAGTNVISAVTITATATDKNSKKGAVSVDKGTITHSPDNVETTWEGSESVIVITNSSSGGDWRVASIVVTFAAGTAPSLTVSPKELSFSLNPSVPTKTQSFTLTGKNLTDGTYDLAVPSVTGLTVTPTQFTVAEGAVSQEVQVTYASTEAVAKATADITATVGEQTAKVTLSYQSRAVAYTQSTVSDAAVWDWGKLTETVELTGETTPAKDSEFLLADLDDRINFVEDFGDAKALKMQVMQFPSRAGYAQGNIIKFKTSVPGTLDVDFCNTGKDRPYRYLNVNGENTTFKSNTADKVSATGISIPAGDVVLKGYIPDAADPQSREGDVVGETMLRWYKITFTPKAFDATFDFANNPQSWPVSTEIADYETGKVTDLTVSNVKLTAIRNNESVGNILYKADGSSPAMFRVGKFNAFKLTAPEGKALVGVAVTMATDGQAFDFEASNGAIVANAWTGNATEVTFTTSNNRQIAKIEITLADENSETIKPAAAVEAATIAEFLALEDGKEVKLTLTDARVNGVNGGSYYVEDATGALVIKGVALTTGTKLNGYILGTKSIDGSVDMDKVIVEHQLTSTDATTFVATAATLEGTVMAVNAAGAQANYGKLITVENVTISGGNNKTLTDPSGNTIKARDYMGVLPLGFEWPAKASKLTGILVYYVTGWYLMPISAEAIVPYVQPTEVTFDFTSADFRGNVGTSAADKAGWILNETQASDFVSIQITAGSSCSRINETSSKPACLTMDKEFSSMTIKAPEGYAITKVEFTTQSETGKVNFTPSSGSLEDKVWTGNAEGVRFNTTLIHYLNTAKVTLAEKNGETTALPAINYIECANIAAFNALDNGTYAKVTLTDAEVIGKSGDNYSNVWVQDATGGCWIQYSSLFALLEEKTKLNGYFYVVKRYANNNNQMKETEDTPKSVFSAEEISDYTMIEGTIAEVNKPENMNRVVKISGAKFVATSATAGTLTQGETTLAVSKGAATQPMQLNKLADQTWVKDETTYENVTVIGIILNKNSGTDQHILPISMTTTTGIRTVGAADNENVQIYNLQGVRLNQLQRGLNIVNGKKIVVK